MKNDNIDFNEYLKPDYDDLDFDSAIKFDEEETFFSYFPRSIGRFFYSTWLVLLLDSLWIVFVFLYQ